MKIRGRFQPPPGPTRHHAALAGIMMTIGTSIGSALVIVSLYFDGPPWRRVLQTVGVVLCAGFWLISYRMRRISDITDDRRRAGLCPHCGYDLRATPERCPECGKTPNDA